MVPADARESSLRTHCSTCSGVTQERHAKPESLDRHCFVPVDRPPVHTSPVKAEGLTWRPAGHLLLDRLREPLQRGLEALAQ